MSYTDTQSNQVYEIWQLPAFDPDNIPDFTTDPSVPTWVQGFISAGYLSAKDNGLWFIKFSDDPNEQSYSDVGNYQTMDITNSPNPPYTEILSWLIFGSDYINENFVENP